MIHIDRNRVDEQNKPIRPNDTWFQNAQKATELAKRERHSHKVKEHIYKHVQVKMALEKLFHYKCAYCESELGETWDVEHFRPSGAIAENPNHPGYYWLAYEWTNLYPSCEPCNRVFIDKPLWDDPTAGDIGGKLTQFPLADESGRAMSHDDDLLGEELLLLDPCASTPEEHFRFDPLGQIYHVTGSLQGETTIKVFFLRRRRLRDLRTDVMNKVVDLLGLIYTLERENRQAAASDFRAYLQKHLLADNCTYAAVARYVYNHPEEFGL
jgi:uncharacterized protein (TIGR02646 family)